MNIQKSYEILELDQNASLDEAERAYKTLVKFYHPDRFVDDPPQKQKAEEKLKEVNFAYDMVRTVLNTKQETEQHHVQIKTPDIQFQSEPEFQTKNETRNYEEFGKRAAKIFQSVFSTVSTAINEMSESKVSANDNALDMKMEYKRQNRRLEGNSRQGRIRRRRMAKATGSASERGSGRRKFK